MESCSGIALSKKVITCHIYTHLHVLIYNFSERALLETRIYMKDPDLCTVKFKCLQSRTKFVVKIPKYGIKEEFKCYTHACTPVSV